MEPLDDREIEIIGECLNALTHPPFLKGRSTDDDWWRSEFNSVMGFSPEEFCDIANRWPNVDFDSTDVRVAVNNSMNNLLGYPHHCEADWPQYISVSPLEVARLLKKWRRLAGEVDGETSSPYFNRLM